MDGMAEWGLGSPQKHDVPRYSSNLVENIHSRKFAVASDPSSAAPSTPQRHGGNPSASKCGAYVLFVAPSCIKRLRLTTSQLPEKFQSIGPGRD